MKEPLEGRAKMDTMPGSAASPTIDSLSRAVEFARTSVLRSADDVRPIAAGLLLSAPSLPAVWSVNQLWVTEALTAEALLELADQHLASTGFRHVTVEHQGTGPALEEALRAAGWKSERDLLMVLGSPPDRVADTSVVVEAGEDELFDQMRRWHEEDLTAPAAVEQLLEYNRREARAHESRMLGVRSNDGQLVAMAQLRSDGTTAQVEDVYTAPEARGRGHARALVSRAVELAREAGHELIFITADDRDWPKLLYERIGFRPAGLIRQFHRA